MSRYITAPYYYREFRCAGSACPDTCCGGWEIRLDRETRETYRKLQREGFDFRGAADLRHGRLIMKDNACPLLEQGLCRIHRDLGEEYLCHTCRRYPRHAEDYGRLHELSLSLSCPEAARLILTGSRESGKLKTAARRAGKVKRGLRDWEEALLFELLKARELMFSLLEMGERPLAHRLAMILALSRDLQRGLNVRGAEGMRKVVRRYRLLETPEGYEWFRKKTAPWEGRLEERYDSMAGFMGLLKSLPEICPGFDEDVSGWMDALYRTDGGFRDYRRAIEKNRRAEQPGLSEGAAYENLARYFLYLYVPGAVYDGDVYSKVKFCLFSVLCIREAALAAGRGTADAGRRKESVEEEPRGEKKPRGEKELCVEEELRGEKGLCGEETPRGEERPHVGETPHGEERPRRGEEPRGEEGALIGEDGEGGRTPEAMGRLAALAYRYSRQTEHSDENLERIESALRRNPAFSMEAFLINLLAEE